MFIVTWLFDKLGYMPKIEIEIGKVDLQLKDAWPFPADAVQKNPILKKPTVKKPVARKRTTKKPAVVAKTTRAKKVQ